MESTIVIKVKYDETLRRFNARVNEAGQMDLDIVGLREKVLRLFNLAPDVDLTLTYIDEDGDEVTLVDKEDLCDVMRQSLDPLRITVKLNAEMDTRFYARSSGNSIPMKSSRFQNPLPKLNSSVSKAAYSSPVLAELVDSFSKMGQTYLNQVSEFQTGKESSTQTGASGSAMDASMIYEPEDGATSEVMPNYKFEEPATKTNQKLDRVNSTRGVDASNTPGSGSLNPNVDLPGDSFLSGSVSVNLAPVARQDAVGDSDETKKKACWDFENTKLFLELVAQEVTNSRWPILTEEGYSNVSKKFYGRTHIYLEPRQLRNKYDLLRKDWESWVFLENPKYGVTGFGYDYTTGTWNASDEWWDMMIQMRPEVAKWRHEGIPHIDEMRAVFHGVVAKSYHVWTPGETRPIVFQSMSHESRMEGDVEMQADDEEDAYRPVFDFQGGTAYPTNPIPATVPVASLPRHSPQLVFGNTTLPAPVAPMVKNLFSPVESEVPIAGAISDVAMQMGRNVRGVGIPEAMERMKCLPGVAEGSEMFWTGVDMIQNDRKRLCFLTLSSDALRLEMVKREGVRRAATMGDAPPRG